MPPFIQPGGAPPGSVAGDVTGGLQVGHDGLDGAFGQPHGGADIPDPGLGIASDLYEHVPVPGQEVQLPPLCSGSLMSPDYITRGITIT